MFGCRQSTENNGKTTQIVALPIKKLLFSDIGNIIAFLFEIVERGIKKAAYFYQKCSIIHCNRKTLLN